MQSVLQRGELQRGAVTRATFSPLYKAGGFGDTGGVIMIELIVDLVMARPFKNPYFRTSVEATKEPVYAP